MINIVYYIHEDDRVIEESINFLAFQTINNSDYQKNYTILKNEKFKTSIKYINLKNIDVINKNIKELIKKEKIAYLWLPLMITYFVGKEF